MDDRVTQNGINYRCNVCGARGREIPVCEDCEPEVEWVEPEPDDVDTELD